MKLELVPFKKHGLIHNCYVLLNTDQIKQNVKKVGKR